MVRNVNVNLNIDFSFTLSCELVGRLTILGFPVNLLGDWLLPNIKHWGLSTAHMLGALKGWQVKGKVSVGEVHEPKVRCTSANSPKICSYTVIC